MFAVAMEANGESDWSPASESEQGSSGKRVM